MPRVLPADHRRALALLADCPEGCTETVMLAHGFTRELLAQLILDGLASAESERMMAEGKMGITPAGRVALER